MAMRGSRLIALGVVGTLGTLAAIATTTEVGSDFVEFAWAKLRGGYSLQERVGQFSPVVSARLRPQVEAAGLSFPPAELTYVVFKDSKLLEVYAGRDPSAAWKLVSSYPVLGLSGSVGPKLSAGDKQVPEGVYRAIFLNPNSRFHLAIGLDYPNELDRRMAVADGRDRLGGDIMIHGTSLSAGVRCCGQQGGRRPLRARCACGTKVDACHH
jgi:hypothetical protein